MTFEHRVTARFFEIDRAGVLFFGRVFEYCHAAFEELVAARLGSVDGFFRGAPWALPVVHAEADFVRAVRLGERLRVQMLFAQAGHSSVRFVYELRGEDDTLRARVMLVHVCVDGASGAPRELPRELTAALGGAGLLVGQDS